MKKLKVNSDACIGCGLCVNMAPDAFTLNDEGKSEAIAEMEDGAADEVIASCPVGAIGE